LTLHSACAVARPYAARSTKHAATDDTITIACLPGLTGYAGGKISACCLVFVIMKSYIAYFIETGYPTIAVTVKCLDPVPWMPGLGVWTPRTILAMATNNTNTNTNTNDNVYGAVIMARPLREFTRFI